MGGQTHCCLAHCVPERGNFDQSSCGQFPVQQGENVAEVGAQATVVIGLEHPLGGPGGQGLWDDLTRGSRSTTTPPNARFG